MKKSDERMRLAIAVELAASRLKGGSGRPHPRELAQWAVEAAGALIAEADLAESTGQVDADPTDEASVAPSNGDAPAVGGVVCALCEKPFKMGQFFAHLGPARAPVHYRCYQQVIGE